MHDEAAMQRAVALGEGARRRSAPNPWVGSVIVDADGTVVGEGATHEPGGPHAEIEALAQAGERSRGSTLFTTLEPCSHTGRTPPCVGPIVAAGIRRVVAALEDPDARVTGNGIAHLRAAGVEVVTGIGAESAARSLAPYLVQRRLGRSFTLLKTASSIDGRVAAADGSSQWITGAAARADAHGLRADSQAVVIGSGTALADRPSLTARDVEPPAVRQPLRVLLDGRGRVPATGSLFDPDLALTLVVTTERAPAAAIDAWSAAGAKVEVLPTGLGGVGIDLRLALELLAGLGVLQALVEGGPALHAALIEVDLADRLVAYVAPTWLGTSGAPMFPTGGPSTLGDAARWRLLDVRAVGADARLELEPVR
ncbi:MAG: riboflavin biosynthesis protein RibD [Actinomycetia bacterium]|nr:riboflavin biosynthesis protein RibD [Actinomycetes bacterium]